MEDGKIEFDTTINTDGIKKGVKEIEDSLKNIGTVEINVNEKDIKKAVESVEELGESLDNATDAAGDFADNTKRIDESLDKTNDATGNLNSGFGGLIDKMKNGIKGAGDFALSFNMVTMAAGKVFDCMKKVKAVIDECSEAYRVQAKAETQLEAAAKNNPMLNGQSVVKLKAFASEIQRVSTIGDEQLLPFMAQLASAGRTQAEIQDIITAAVDLEASGLMSLDSAVSQLNATYNGTVGMLGKQIGAVKDLTAEELKSGKAVEIVKKQFAGMAEETTKATGTTQQLKNAWGDLKEELGAPFEKALAPMRQFFTELLSNLTNELSLRRKIKEAHGALEEGNVNEENLEALKSEYARLKKDYDTTRESKRLEMSGYGIEGKEAARQLNNDPVLNKQLEQMSKLKAQIDEAEKKLKQAEVEAKTAAAQVEAQAKEAAAVAEAEQVKNTANNKAAEAYAQYEKTIAAKKEEIRWRKEAGEAISEETEKQEMLDTEMQAWLTMIENSEGTISGTRGKAAEIMTQIKADYAEVQELIANGEMTEAARQEAEKALKEYESAIQQFANEVNRIYTTTLSPGEVLDQQIADMKASYEKLTNDEKYLATMSKEERIKLEEEYTAAYEELCRQRAEMAKQEAEQESQQRIQSMQQTMGKVQSFVGAFSNMVNSIASTAMEYVTAEKEARLAEIQEQYDQGLISLEEYEEEKEKIEREAAEEEYKIKMWQWTADVISATANIASAVINTLAEYPGPLGIAMAAMVGAAGAAQLASVIASKPQPPSFATGGIVGGNSYKGDKIQANVNSGEMILNAQQQKNLFDAINNGNLGGGNGFTGDVKIYNYASDEVDAKPEITNDEIVILINKTVNDSLSRGTYTESLKMAQSLQTGTRFTN